MREEQEAGRKVAKSRESSSGRFRSSFIKYSPYRGAFSNQYGGRGQKSPNHITKLTIRVACDIAWQTVCSTMSRGVETSVLILRTEYITARK